jgi:hypothetical protein
MVSMWGIAIREKKSKILAAAVYCAFAVTVLAGSAVLVAQSGLSLQTSVPSDKAGMSVTT